MRSLLPKRARMLVAGIGMLAAGLLTGCWNSPNNPLMRNPNQNIPKTNVNSGIPSGAAGSKNATGAQPTGASSGGFSAGAMNTSGSSTSGAVSRQSGAPSDPAGRVGLSSGAIGGATSPGSALGPPPGAASGASGVQPIATNNPVAGRSIQPVGTLASGAGAEQNLDPPPSARAKLRERDLPGVQPITTQDVTSKRTWQRVSPEMPQDVPVVSLPSAPPAPKGRAADSLAPLSPPPQ